jgi:prolyl-tRNA synthetase
MRMSRLFGSTLREAPGGVEAVGHQWLLRAGFLRQLNQGVFSYLPLGQRVIKRIEDILRQEMDAVDGNEVSMPVVHPAELWRRSGREQAIGPELTRLKDRRDRDMVLAMTHEEVVAELAASEIHSWRQLPKLVYQIQTKWRDDPRPRAGLIRAREFTMKDAYSLDRDAEGLDVQYDRQYQAYFNIFGRCGLPTVAVGADVGMMGGTASHEFMYLNPLGEDTLVFCDHCGYADNRQVAKAGPPAIEAEEPLPVERVETPDTPTIEALARLLAVPEARTAKVVFMAATRKDENGKEAVVPVVAVVRGDHEVNETKLANAVRASELRPLTGPEIEAIGCVPGYASPIGVGERALVVVDEIVAASPNLVAGANEAGWHLRNVNVGRDYQPDLVVDLVAVGDGMPCPNCGSSLRTERGIEVGNIFKLGTRYSTALGATYLDADGVERPIVMGSYGIGVGRLLACVAEHHHDDNGLRWPMSIAPFQVHLCAIASPKDGDTTTAAAASLYAELSAAGVEVLWDDRGERAGVQFADADLIGIPLRLTVAPRSLAAGGVEAKLRRGGDPLVVPVAEVVGWVQAQMAALLAEVTEGMPQVSLAGEAR